MEVTLFKKMKGMSGSTGCAINAPDDYRIEASRAHFDPNSNVCDFCTSFVRSSEPSAMLLENANPMR